MPVVSTTPFIDALVRDANTLPELQAKLAPVEPMLAAGFTTKCLVLAKSPPVVALAGFAATYGAAHGLNWSPDFTAFAGSAVVLGVGYVMRYLSPTRIEGIFRSPKSVAAIPVPVPQVRTVTPAATATNTPTPPPVAVVTQLTPAMVAALAAPVPVAQTALPSPPYVAVSQHAPPYVPVNNS